MRGWTLQYEKSLQFYSVITTRVNMKASSHKNFSLALGKFNFGVFFDGSLALLMKWVS